MPITKEKTETKQVPYSDKELQAREEIIEHLDKAHNQRSQRYDELDGMTYDEYYESNKKAALAFLRPKLNKEDVRISSGTVKEKCNTILASLLNKNLEGQVLAYDEFNSPNKWAGKGMTDAIRKSRKLEQPDYELKRALIYTEFVTQGTVFVMERWLEFQRLRKRMDGKDEWKEEIEDYDARCDIELIPGLNVYLGNIREFFLENQPYVAIRYVRSRSQAEAMYRDWEVGGQKRWNYVPKELVRTGNKTQETGTNTYDDYQMIETEADLVEEIIYMNKWTNTLQVMLNGVMMLPVGYPLETLAGCVDYPMAKGDGEPISSKFAISKSTPAKAKFSEAIMNEFYMAMIVKTRKSYKPPISNLTGQKLSKAIFLPGTIHENVDADKIKPIGDNMGVTAPEFNMFRTVKEIIDNASVSPIMEGQQATHQQTAREAMILEQKAMMKMGLVMLGIINLHRKLDWLRLNNILAHWTKPIDSKIDETREGLKKLAIYRTESVETKTDEGMEAEHILEFTNEKLPTDNQVAAEERVLTKARGKKVMKTYFNVDELRKLKYKWFIEVTATEKSTTELRAALFEETALKMLQIGPEKVNVDYLLEQMALNANLDPDKLLQQAQPQMPAEAMGAMQGAQQGAPNQLGGQIQPKQMPRPSVNTLQQAGA